MRRRRILTPTNRKRLEFVALIPLGALGGQIHHDRWPERSAFGRTRFAGPQRRRRYKF